MHKSAHGVSIKQSQLDNFITESNEKFKNLTYENVLYVDFQYNNKCPVGIINNLDQYRYLYGQGISEPSIAVCGLTVSRENCYFIGKHNDTIKIIDQNNICYMLFSQSENVIDLFARKINGNTATINVVGRGNVNHWGGRAIEQLFVDDFEFVNKIVF